MVWLFLRLPLNIAISILDAAVIILAPELFFKVLLVDLLLAESWPWSISMQPSVYLYLYLFLARLIWLVFTHEELVCSHFVAFIDLFIFFEELLSTGLLSLVIFLIDVFIYHAFIFEDTVCYIKDFIPDVI